MEENMAYFEVGHLGVREMIDRIGLPYEYLTILEMGRVVGIFLYLERTDKWYLKTCSKGRFYERIKADLNISEYLTEVDKL